jgi:hypothetical protein
MEFSAKSPRLRQAPERWQKTKKNVNTLNTYNYEKNSIFFNFWNLFSNIRSTSGEHNELNCK